MLAQPAPTIAPGTIAELTLIDTQVELRVDPAGFHSLARNTPFAGWKLRARPVMTVCRGRITYCGASIKAGLRE